MKNHPAKRTVIYYDRSSGAKFCCMARIAEPLPSWRERNLVDIRDVLYVIDGHPELAR